ncbi:hypothetical protein TNIN_129091 [Trichonephila inaurata madagascariensis]|uniref:Secreted protein n=1 Tax=Trichonephila inaurata madagascariensis TaxID=2747483 RepID=A0A8X6YVI3_9ARAC|nr:hypothetical protein TNIN_129091 [Trichonephila inaurata madagascariensis]
MIHSSEAPPLFFLWFIFRTFPLHVPPTEWPDLGSGRSRACTGVSGYARGVRTGLHPPLRFYMSVIRVRSRIELVPPQPRRLVFYYGRAETSQRPRKIFL